MARNSIQFNGEFGCTFCEQPGETNTTAEGGHSHVYPFDERNPDGPHRTAANTNKYAEVAVTTNTVVRTSCKGLLHGFFGIV